MAQEKPDTKKVIKATQIAFEVERRVAKNIQRIAVDEGLTTSSQIRKSLGLTYSPPKRPRLTVSLSTEDYEILAQRYKLNAEDTLAIKRAMMEELIGRYTIEEDL